MALIFTKGPVLNGVTDFEFSDGQFPRLVYPQDPMKYSPHCQGASQLKIPHGAMVKVRPAWYLWGLLIQSNNYELLWQGKWLRVQLIV